MATSSAVLVDTGEFEAVTEAELVPDAPEAAASASETHRAIGKVASEPARPSGQSGIRPSPAALAVRIEAALRASTKTEATLADLLRTAKFLSASIDAVREANTAVLRELEVLCELVDGEGAERSSLERRIQRLEHLVDETGRDAARDRRFLVEEHDAFIATLVSDHERELQALRERLAELEQQPAPSSEHEEAGDRS
ncbi:MAG TPA: hypothetical protein VFQ35_16295 [Polyangiaceae bacterium]|nr:hypothetical protein [Polyangiaceae bacterium]